jgi:hypothetical protein
MTDVWSKSAAKSRRHKRPFGGIHALLIAIGAFGVSSSARAVPLTVNGVYLQYINEAPGFDLGGETIGFGGSVTPNGSASTNGVGVATTGFAATTNSNTGSPITFPVSFSPGPLIPDFFRGAFLICTTTCTPSGNNNLNNLTEPWTITFQNTATTPTSVSTTISLQGGEIPFVNSVTLSGTAANPTFSWSPPLNTTIEGYRIEIYQQNSGLVVSKTFGPTVRSYTVQASDFTVPGFQFMQNTNYTIAIVALQTRDGSTTNLSLSNINAESYSYSTFRTLPKGAPAVNLPNVTLVGSQVIYGFNLTVQPGITYFIDPAVATSYIYQTSSGNPNFASVELPDIGNPTPYDLYLWNGTSFVFDTTLAPDTVFDFANGGVSEFEVLGIDPNLGLDPENTTAFITGLTFESAGNFTGTMKPITTAVAAAPEPGSLALLASGLLGLGLLRRRRWLL